MKLCNARTGLFALFSADAVSPVRWDEKASIRWTTASRRLRPSRATTSLRGGKSLYCHVFHDYGWTATLYVDLAYSAKGTPAA